MGSNITSLRDLTPDRKNANKGTKRGRAMVASSVQRYGRGRSVGADKHGRLIAGNKTVEAAGQVGIEDMIVVPTDGTKLIVHQRMDLDLETDVAAKELAIADNRTGEVGLQWELDTLRDLEGEGVNLHEFFGEKELDALLDEQNQADEASSGDEVAEMGIRPFEHHDYIMVVCSNVHDWTRACDLLGVTREKVTLGGQKKFGLGRVITAARLFRALGQVDE